MKAKQSISWAKEVHVLRHDAEALGRATFSRKGSTETFFNEHFAI